MGRCEEASVLKRSLVKMLVFAFGFCCVLKRGATNPIIARDPADANSVAM